MVGGGRKKEELSLYDVRAVGASGGFQIQDSKFQITESVPNLGYAISNLGSLFGYDGYFQLRKPSEMPERLGCRRLMRARSVRE